MPRRPDDIWIGVAAGIAGGLAASYAMGLVHRKLSAGIAADNQTTGPDATVLAASAVSECVFRHRLSPRERQVAAPLVHYTFGSAVGAVYGAAAAIQPKLATGAGIPLGAAVWLGAHALAVPRFGLADSPLERPLAGEAVEFAAHLVYGAVADGVRRGVFAAVRALS